MKQKLYRYYLPLKSLQTNSNSKNKIKDIFMISVVPSWAIDKSKTSRIGKS